MNEEIIEDNGIIYAKIYRDSLWPENLNFYTQDKDFVQVSTWNYNKGKHLKAHKHKIAERISNKTQEVIFIKSGSLNAYFYSEDNKLICNKVIKTGDFVIIFSGGHAYDILENNTQVFEVKNGPYLGLDIDKQLIE